MTQVRAPECKVGWNLVLDDVLLGKEVKVALQDLIRGVVGGGERRPRPGEGDLFALDGPLQLHRRFQKY